MSSFITPERERRQSVQAVSQMNPDALEGLRTAVNNNQSAIALRYVLSILDILDAERSAAKAASVKKTTPPAKAATADKVDE